MKLRKPAALLLALIIVWHRKASGDYDYRKLKFV